MAAKTSIIVPLYIYPSPDAWSILHTSISTHPNLHFLVIVNPYNGPGPDSVPDENYLREIPKLNTYDNVSVLGYVHVSFAHRNVSEILRDIDVYSSWPSNIRYPGLFVSGIFVDETPNTFDVRAEKFLKELTKHAKEASGLGTDPLIVHNPGSVPPLAYSELADVTVVFEDTLPNFLTRNAAGHFDFESQQQQQQHHRHNDQRRHHADPRNRERCAVMIHSIPGGLDAMGKGEVVRRAREIAGHVFFTDLEMQFYESFSPAWLDWIDLVAQE